jgi:hypothetical protein
MPFGKKKTEGESKKTLALVSNGPKKSNDGTIVDHGSLGDLDYCIYSRRIIIIRDPENTDLVFKKDIDLFQTELGKIDFNSMVDGDEFVIKGSGDNDNIVFIKHAGEINISIRKREFSAVESLKNILSAGKKKLGNSKEDQ